MSARDRAAARAEVLDRVRAALALAPPAGGPVVRDYRRAGEDVGVELLDLFVERVEDYRAVVRRTDAAGLAAQIAEALAAAPASAGGSGRARIGVPPGLPDSWLSDADVELVRDDGLGIDELDRLDGVVTAVAVAIAETGTFVLDGSPDQGRRALTLVPDLHVCIVRAAQVVRGVPEALVRLRPSRPLTWVSGPSATSDIELERVEGVHGPRRLVVILVG